MEAFEEARLSLDQQQYGDLHCIPSYQGSGSREQGATPSREPCRAAWPPKNLIADPNCTQYERDLTSDAHLHLGESLAVGPDHQ
eukprot:7492771-Pyramimonas_sp.AAC.1